MVSIGRLYFEIHILSVSHVNIVKRQVIYPKGMRCHKPPILFYEIFGVWGIDFMGSIPVSFGYVYILLVVDYVSKWVEAKATRTEDSKFVTNFIKSNIFSRFGIPRALISDRGTHFCNRTVETLLRKYNVTHKVSTTYHSQTNGQAEVSN